MRWLTLMFAVTMMSLVSVAHATQAAKGEERDPHTHFFMPKMGDFKDELNTARSERKQGVLIMFEMEECPFCSRMKASVLNQSEVQDWYRKHFLIYNVDVRGDTPMVDFKGEDTTEKAFALKNRARATPTFLFFDLDGNVVTRFTGATQSAGEFLLLGRFVVDGEYKNTKFDVYKRQRPAP